MAWILPLATCVPGLNTGLLLLKLVLTSRLLTVVFFVGPVLVLFKSTTER